MLFMGYLYTILTNVSYNAIPVFESVGVKYDRIFGCPSFKN